MRDITLDDQASNMSAQSPLRPLGGSLSAMDIAFPDRPAPPPDEVPQAHFRVASPNYFAAAGIPIYAGREFTDRDGPRSQLFAVVSRTFAQRHWPGGSRGLANPFSWFNQAHRRSSKWSAW